MINYDSKLLEQKIKRSIVCDICNKEYEVNGEDLHAMFEAQEFIHIDFRGGYGSIFGDGTKVSLDICQHCLKEKLGQYLRMEKPMNSYSPDDPDYEDL